MDIQPVVLSVLQQYQVQHKHTTLTQDLTYTDRAAKPLTMVLCCECFRGYVYKVCFMCALEMYMFMFTESLIESTRMFDYFLPNSGVLQ